MTRVEKFHRYREEIANMKVENFTEKKITSDQVEMMIDSKGSKNLDCDEIYTAYNLDGKKTKFSLNLRISQLIYFVIACVVIGTLVALLFIF